MKKEIYYPFIVGALLLAIGASGQSVVGVEVNKAEINNIHKTFELLVDTIRIQSADIKTLIGRKR